MHGQNLSAAMGCQGAILMLLVGMTIAFGRANAAADRDGTEVEGSSTFRYTL
ncbi:BQ5605_C002g01416 [Microbotryum silenes-dioicae]|uniref:BQ5605_C002g01416 protein n=1 Tax=Microbotryum silenes-dioicae TaxID=796604 RepID=A0A2X0LYN0_9BASI|nr:BQ5605_C002g01416 [Microbotryum silenes-dioicae]